MKKLLSFILLITLSFSLAACGKTEEGKEKSVNKVDEEENLTIGLSFDSFVIERWQRDRDIFVSTATDLGAEVNVQSANGEVEEQIEQIEYFIDKNVDCIVVIATDATALTDVIGKAKKEGIPVICYDRVILNGNADLYISFDNKAVGTLMADSIYGATGEGSRILMIGGSKTDYNVAQVTEGFSEVCDKYNMEIVDTYNCDNWRAELAYEYVNEYADKLDEIDAIMCGNDLLAGEAIYALAERRLAGKIPVVGQDADLEACQRIVEDLQLMTVYKPVEKLAKVAAEYAVKLAKREKIGETETFNDGRYDIPYIALEPIKVNKTNMDNTIIDSGFHIREDVYLNVE